MLASDAKIFQLEDECIEPFSVINDIAQKYLGIIPSKIIPEAEGFIENFIPYIFVAKELFGCLSEMQYSLIFSESIRSKLEYILRFYGENYLNNPQKKTLDRKGTERALKKLRSEHGQSLEILVQLKNNTALLKFWFAGKKILQLIQRIRSLFWNKKPLLEVIEILQKEENKNNLTLEQSDEISSIKIRLDLRQATLEQQSLLRYLEVQQSLQLPCIKEGSEIQDGSSEEEKSEGN